MAATYEPIASQTLGSDAAAVEFASISGSYTDLILVMSTRSASAAATDAVFTQVGNGTIDTGSNYSTTVLYHSGSSAASTRASNSSRFDFLATAGNNAASSVFGVQTLHFMSYSNTAVNKTVLAATTAGGDSPRRAVGLWRSTSAIDRIKVAPQNGNFKSGSTFSLYGVKAA